MKNKVGVYLCSCGNNISETVDLEELSKFSSTIENVSYVKIHQLLCSEDGKNFLGDDILKESPEKIVIAACSPREHEHTFKKVCLQSGMNPYLFQMVNIREQVAWTTNDKEKATEKAKHYVNAAIKRVVLHNPIEKKEVDCNTDVLIIGAGAAGMSCALSNAKAGRKVYLVEKSPCIGGKVVTYEEVFPKLECAACMMEPKMDEVLHDENIELLTYSEVQQVLGFLGNFIVKIKNKAKYVDKNNCFGCDPCYSACPVTVKNEFNYGLSERKAIYVPYPGALPNVPVIDMENCLRSKGEDCKLCQQACSFGAINFDEKDETLEVNVGAVVVAVGFKDFNPEVIPELGYKKIPEVYTALEFERMLSATGHTEGKIIMKNQKEPESITIINCVGSRSEKYNNYCSGVCCLYSLKFDHLIEKNLPDVKINHIYYDWCLPGKGSQEFFNSVSKSKNINFIQSVLSDNGNIKLESKKEKINISYADTSGKKNNLTSDMVVLCTAMESASDTLQIAEMLSIPQGKDGFLIESHNKLAPVASDIDGIYIAGSVQGPKDIQNSVVQGEAASGNILSSLVPGRKLEVEEIVAEINEELCGGCKICISLCPYIAIIWDEEKKVSVSNSILCKGCGTCVAACPSGAITGYHFTTQQIFAEIEGVLA